MTFRTHGLIKLAGELECRASLLPDLKFTIIYSKYGCHVALRGKVRASQRILQKKGLKSRLSKLIFLISPSFPPHSFSHFPFLPLPPSNIPLQFAPEGGRRIFDGSQRKGKSKPRSIARVERYIIIICHSYLYSRLDIHIVHDMMYYIYINVWCGIGAYLD